MTLNERLQIAILAADQIEREPAKVTFTEQRARNIKKQLLAISAELRESNNCHVGQSHNHLGAKDNG